jgi:hypothetical protein
MTAPPDPLSTLIDAVNRYTTAQDAMKEAAQQLITTEPNQASTQTFPQPGAGNAVPS